MPDVADWNTVRVDAHGGTKSKHRCDPVHLGQREGSSRAVLDPAVVGPRDSACGGHMSLTQREPQSTLAELIAELPERAVRQPYGSIQRTRCRSHRWILADTGIRGLIRGLSSADYHRDLDSGIRCRTYRRRRHFGGQYRRSCLRRRTFRPCRQPATREGRGTCPGGNPSVTSGRH